MINATHAATPPARESNPFATCWTKPGSLPFVSKEDSGAMEGEFVEALLPRLAKNGWRSQVVGPHGSGKSTLLLALSAKLAPWGKRATHVNLTRGVECFASTDLHDPGSILLIEGFERLDWVVQRRVLAKLNHQKSAYLVTTHHAWAAWPSRLPVLVRLRPNVEKMLHLFRRLTHKAQTPVTEQDAIHSFRRQQGDVRKVWFDLHQLHELRSRPDRTAQVLVSYAG